MLRCYTTGTSAKREGESISDYDKHCNPGVVFDLGSSFVFTTICSNSVLTENVWPETQQKRLNFVRSEVLTAERMTMLFFWVLKSCRLVGRNQRFREAYCLHLQGWRAVGALNMETVCLSKTLVSIPTKLHGIKPQKNIVIWSFS
jgi:hypothetical protein